jgi:hypothetical protein
MTKRATRKSKWELICARPGLESGRLSKGEYGSPSRTAASAKAISQLGLLQCAICGTLNWKNECPLPPHCFQSKLRGQSGNCRPLCAVRYRLLLGGQLGGPDGVYR